MKLSFKSCVFASLSVCVISNNAYSSHNDPDNLSELSASPIPLPYLFAAINQDRLSNSLYPNTFISNQKRQRSEDNSNQRVNRKRKKTHSKYTDQGLEKRSSLNKEKLKEILKPQYADWSNVESEAYKKLNQKSQDQLRRIWKEDSFTLALLETIINLPHNLTAKEIFEVFLQERFDENHRDELNFHTIRSYIYNIKKFVRDEAFSIHNPGVLEVVRNTWRDPREVLSQPPLAAIPIISGEESNQLINGHGVDLYSLANPTPLNPHHVSWVEDDMQIDMIISFKNGDNI